MDSPKKGSLARGIIITVAGLAVAGSAYAAFQYITENSGTNLTNQVNTENDVLETNDPFVQEDLVPNTDNQIPADTQTDSNPIVIPEPIQVAVNPTPVQEENNQSNNEQVTNDQNNEDNTSDDNDSYEDGDDNIDDNADDNTNDGTDDTGDNDGDDNSDDDNQNDGDVPTVTGLSIADFEDASLDKWTGNMAVVEPGANSSKALQLTNPTNESVAAAREIEAPILNGYTDIELDLKAVANTLLSRDASAIAFEQDGDWKWVSLADYADPAENGWQHIKMPLSDFTGLDQTKNVAKLIFRFWGENENNFLIDNISLTGKIETELARPENLSGNVVSDHQIDLTWSGVAAKFNIYQDDNKIAETTENTFSITGLTADTTYKFYVSAANDSEESTPSESISLKTLPPIVPDLVIADFEDGTANGWSEGILVPGFNSTYALELTNPENDSIGMSKLIDSEILKGHKNLEFDININGAFYFDDAAITVFDQDGWKKVFLANYLQNGSTEWQHVVIPLSDFAELNSDQAVAQIIFRFWNFSAVATDIDNIVLK